MNALTILERVVTLAGMAFVLAPPTLLAFGPPPLWGRGAAVVALGVVAGLIWKNVDWPSGWGLCRDLFCWAMMFSTALGVLGLLSAGVMALLGR